MKHAFLIRIALIAALMSGISAPALAQVVPVPRLMNFQGRLTRPDGTSVADGVYSVRLSLWSAASGGTEKWNQTLTVTARQGMFAALLNVGTGPANLFSGDNWLEIKIGTATALTPRQQIVTVAYAFKADSVKDGAITTNSLANSAVTAAKIANGTITADKLVSGIFNPLVWLLNGNSGTNGTQFLGTSDNQPLVLKVNGRQAMRYSYGENILGAGFEYRGINVLGGSDLNSIGAGVVGATIAGGGLDYFSRTDLPNSISADFGAIGGGYNNTVSQESAAIAGGGNNMGSGPYATVGGGFFNTASAQAATVSGGGSNTASGSFSTVAGGYLNTASGDYSVAAGRRAQAHHTGSFVWADSQDADFASTDLDQFVIRARGGVGVNMPAKGTVGVSAQGAATGIYGQGDTVGVQGNSGNGYGVYGASGGGVGLAGVYGEALQAGGTGVAGIGGTTGVYGTGVDYAGAFDGNVRYSGVLLHASDARYKTHIQTILSPLKALRELRGVSYAFDRERFPKQRFPEGEQLGFIAQEVEQVLPGLVKRDAAGYRSLDYIQIVPLLVESVKAQHREMESLRAENAAVKARLAEIVKTVSELKARRKKP